MILKRISLINYRNYLNLQASFSDGINFLFGKNGQGKTNLLEAIYFTSTMKSHRINNDKALIASGNEFARAILEVNGSKVDKKLSFTLSSKGKKLFINQKPIKKLSAFIGKINAVLFCPDDINLFVDSPQKRRNLIDIELSKLSNSYTIALKKYKQLLRQRNDYLKSAKKIDETFINCLDEQLIDVQLIIIEQRNKFLFEIFKNGYAFYCQFVDEDDFNLSYKYLSFVDYNENKAIMRSSMQEKYRNSLKRDILTKTTNVGIHRDDFMYFLDDKEIKSVASQGQKKSIALSVKMGIASTIYSVCGEYPVILLDDIFSELDSERRAKLIKLLEGKMQVFITSNDRLEVKSDKIKYFEVTNNQLVEV